MVRPGTYFAVEITMYFICGFCCIVVVVADLHATVNHIKIFSVAQQCFYGTCISPTIMQIIQTGFLKK